MLHEESSKGTRAEKRIPEACTKNASGCLDPTTAPTGLGRVLTQLQHLPGWAAS